jgi:large subunit ribosomal protein L5
MATTKPAKPIVTNSLKQLYVTQYRQELLKELDLSNLHTVPRIDKIVLNIGTGKAKDDKKFIDTATNTLRKITGQQPIKTLSKKSIAAFKLRAGSEVGLKVTLRDDRMYEFLERLINIILPRLRDFHGVPLSAFDKQGNYSLGLKEQSVFPELSFEETTTLHGLQVNIAIRNTTGPEQSQALLIKFGMPFESRKEGK